MKITETRFAVVVVKQKKLSLHLRLNAIVCDRSVMIALDNKPI